MAEPGFDVSTDWFKSSHIQPFVANYQTCKSGLALRIPTTLHIQGWPKIDFSCSHGKRHAGYASYNFINSKECLNTAINLPSLDG